MIPKLKLIKLKVSNFFDLYSIYYNPGLSKRMKKANLKKEGLRGILSIE